MLSYTEHNCGIILKVLLCTITVEANSVESRYSGVLDGWIEDTPDDDHHDEHTLELLKHHVRKYLYININTSVVLHFILCRNKVKLKLDNSFIYANDSNVKIMQIHRICFLSTVMNFIY